MPAGRQLRRTDLFLVRMWTEETSDGEKEWCGRVQRTVDGEAHNFRGWPMLIDLLLAMVSSGAAGPGGRHLWKEDPEEGIGTKSEPAP